jgi:hypothetical protein
VTNTQHAWDCVSSACYTTKTGSSNLVAGVHNTFNYIAGLPPVAEPYPCSNGDAFALGGQLPYWAVGILVPGAGDVAAIDDLYFDDLPPAAEGGAAGAVEPSAFPNFEDPAQHPGPGWEWRGSGPQGSSQGSWYNPSTDESLHPDLGHGGSIGPHYDYRAPDGVDYRVYPDGQVIPK